MPRKGVKQKLTTNLVDYLEQKMELAELTPAHIDFAIGIFQGRDAFSVGKELFKYKNEQELRRYVKKLMNSQKIKNLIKLISEKYTDNLVINANTLLQRLEIIYSVAVEENNQKKQMDVIKLMNEVMKANPNMVNVQGDVKFELPTRPKRQADKRHSVPIQSDRGVGKMKKETKEKYETPTPRIVIIPEDENNNIDEAEIVE